MDRVAELLVRAGDVSRRIFASLPWKVRVGLLLDEIIRLAYSDPAWIADYAKQIGAEMLRSGVTGMPEPGHMWKPEKGDPRTLSSEFAKAMAGFLMPVYRILAGKGAPDDAIAEGIADYIGKLQDGRIKLQPVAKSAAESFIRQGIIHAVGDVMKKRRRERKIEKDVELESLTDYSPDAKTLQHEVEDPSSLERFKEHMDPMLFNKWMSYLEKHVHPDIRLFFELRLEGYSVEDIVGNPKEGKPSKLPHYKGTPQNWNQNYRKKIVDKSLEFFKSIGTDEGEFTPRDLAELMAPHTRALV
jgi:hypothetical protein